MSARDQTIDPQHLCRHIDDEEVDGDAGRPRLTPVHEVARLLGAGDEPLTADVRRTLTAQLRDVGYTSRPSLEDAEPHAQVVLVPLAHERVDDGEAHLGVRHFTDPEPHVSAGAAFIIEAPVHRPLVVRQAIESVTGSRRLTDELIVELAGTDDRPRARPVDGDDRSWIVSSFGAAFAGSREPGRSLHMRPVEMLVTPDFLLVCVQREDGPRPTDATTFIDRTFDVLRRRLDLKPAASQELRAAYILSQLSSGYDDAVQELVQQLQRAEDLAYEGLALLAASGGAGSERASDLIGDAEERMHHVRKCVGRLRTKLGGLESAMRVLREEWIEARDEPDALLGREVRRITRDVDAALNAVERLGERVRGTFALLESGRSRRQLELAEENRRQGEELQDRLTIITVVFLVPTLVAGIFGMNVRLPLSDSDHGFLDVVALMLLCALVVTVIISVVSRRRTPSGTSLDERPSQQ